jgi:hypothetical protein
MPVGRWQCPWHYCVECKRLLEGEEGGWCLHCPNAYCPAHRGALQAHAQLGRICDQHEDEWDSLLDVMRVSKGKNFKNSIHFVFIRAQLA